MARLTDLDDACLRAVFDRLDARDAARLAVAYPKRRFRDEADEALYREFRDVYRAALDSLLNTNWPHVLRTKGRHRGFHARFAVFLIRPDDGIVADQYVDHRGMRACITMTIYPPVITLYAAFPECEEYRYRFCCATRNLPCFNMPVAENSLPYPADTAWASRVDKLQYAAMYAMFHVMTDL